MSEFRNWTATLGCCAIGSLRVDNNDTIESLRASIAEAVRQYKLKGITTLQVVVTKNEKKIEKELKALGFRTGFLFKRRRSYDKSNLKMLILDLEDYCIKNSL